MALSWVDVVIVIGGGLLLWRVFRTYATVERIQPDAVRELLEGESDIEIVDVRTQAEFEAWHIPGARSWPVHEFQLEPKKYAALLRRDTPVVVVCETGSRSVPAYHTLKKLGFDTVYNMHGGMVSWRGPVVRGSDQ